MDRPWEHGIAGCELCIADGEANGRPFLVCTEACAAPEEEWPSAATVTTAPPGVWCLPCLRTFGDGRPRHVPAAYIWCAPDDHETPLCVRCCAGWRANAEEEPDFAPARIREL